MDIKQHKQNLLELLYKPYLFCQECPLANQGRKNIIFGYGNADSEIIFIGEGPGKQEDTEGLPFIGKSGQILSKVFTKLNINRSDIFITNIVKCRPPNNRIPLTNEISICKKILLEKQIEIIRPKLIFTLGATATFALLETQINLKKIRGTIQYYNQILLIPTYHPAYILRQPKAFIFLIDDINTGLQLLRINKDNSYI